MGLEYVSGAVGIDEAGRGPLAGPVVAAAVLIPGHVHIEGLNDSKKLSPAKREKLAAEIKERTVWSIAEVDHLEIDRINILNATFKAMRNAAAGLGAEPCSVLIDGNLVPPGMRGLAVVKGDGRYACIAAASILAKTYRDDLMRKMAEIHPEYGFDVHFGYPTPEHLETLRRLGPCPIHRMSFGPCREEQRALSLAFDA